MPVQTTTSGSLPRTQALIDANKARAFDDDRVIEPGERVSVIEIRGATALVD